MASAITTIVITARFAVVMTPSSTSATITATAPSAPAITVGRRASGSGFGTTFASGPRFLRPNEYCSRPSAMPIAASPNP